MTKHFGKKSAGLGSDAGKTSLDAASDALAVDAGAVVQAVRRKVSADPNVTLNGTATANTLNGGSGNDTLNGLGGNDTLNGNAGNDLLNGGTGTDSMKGGADNDIYVVDVATDKTIEVAGGGTDTVRSTLTWTLAGEVENLELMGTAAINGTGNGLANKITGNSAVNTLNGGGGNDTLDGKAGADNMIGGAGDDVFVVDNAGDVTTEVSGGGTDTVQSSISTTLAAQVENLLLAGSAAIGGTGNTLANSLTGNSGDNALDGGVGRDSLDGGAGDDTLIMAAVAEVIAAESYDGGAGEDMLNGVDIETAMDLTGVTLANLETVIGFSGGLTLTAGQLDQFTGDVNVWGDINISGAGAVDLRDARVFSDVINLSSAGNTLTIGGGRGLSGGYFDGEINGGAAADTVTVTGFNGDRGAVLRGNGGNDSLTGGGMDDTIYGGAGRDTVNGGRGDDYIRVNAFADLVAGEVYNGGDGEDEINGNFRKFVDFSALGTTFTNLENISGFNRGVMMSAAQLDQFTGEIDVYGDIRLSGAGVVDIRDAAVFSDNIYLSNAGNTLLISTGDENADGGGYFTGNVYGGTGADSIAVFGGSEYSDSYYGDSVRLYGGAGNDTLLGSDNADSLYGGTGLDSVNGGAGGDYIYINEQADLAAGEVYNGGADQDELISGYGVNTLIDFATPNVTLTGIENIYGFYDGVRMTSAQLNGFTGSINVRGDITISNAGVIDISDANVHSNIIVLSNSGNTLILRAGTPVADEGGLFNGTVIGGTAADTITVLGGTPGEYGAELYGYAGNDTLNGSDANDTLAGGAGADAIFGGGGDDIFLIDSLAGWDELDVMVGGAGIDLLDASGITNAFTLTSVLYNMQSIEGITGFYGGLSLNFARLAQFTSLVDVRGDLTLLDAGVVDLTMSEVRTNTIYLSNASNTQLSMTGGENNFNGTVYGGSGNDTVLISGGEIGDSNYGVELFGNGGNDSLQGGNADDSLTGGAGIDSLNGGDGDDTLYIVAATDVGGAEVYNGGLGIDTLDGESVVGSVNFGSPAVTLSGIEVILGFDDGVTMTAAQLNQFTTGVHVGGVLQLTGGGTVNLSGAWVTTNTINLGGSATTITLDAGVMDDVNFNGTVNGGGAADTITVTGGYSLIDSGGYGYASNTTLNGNGGNDTINGSNGNDLISGGAGADQLFGGDGNDRFEVASATHFAAGEVYNGGAGDDVLDGSDVVAAVNLSTLGVTLTSIERITGFAGGLTMTGAQMAMFTGGVAVQGNLTLTTGGVVDMTGVQVLAPQIFLANGGTHITLDMEFDNGGYYAAPSFNGSVFGGSSGDTITILNGDGGYSGDNSGVTVNGNGGNDTITGGGAADTLAGGDGVDVVNGGDGNDQLVIAAASDLFSGETYNGGLGRDTLDGTGVAGMANLALINLTVTGIEEITGFNDGLTMNVAQLGGDLERISVGSLTLNNGGVVDLSSIELDTQFVTLSESGNTITVDMDVRVGGGYGYGSNFTGTINGGSAADTITVIGIAHGGAGYSPGVTLNGGGGNDTITGADTDDTINGGAGADVMDGGAGDDVFMVGTASDIATGESYDGGYGNDRIDGSAVTTAVNFATAGVVIADVEQIVGFSGGLTLTAGQLSAFSEEINTGAITISGAGNVDLAGAAVLADTINMGSNGRELTLMADGGYGAPGFLGTINGGGGVDVITLAGGAYGYAGSLLRGLGGADVLNGSTSADTLEGGGGADQLFGGGYDADVFRFGTDAFGSVDTINDLTGLGGVGFSAEVDVIEIVGGATSVVYQGSAGFAGGGTTSARFDGTNLRVDFDGNGTGDLTISIVGMSAATDLDQTYFL